MGRRFTLLPSGDSHRTACLSHGAVTSYASAARSVSAARAAPTGMGATPPVDAPVMASAGAGFHRPRTGPGGGRSRSHQSLQEGSSTDEEAGTERRELIGVRGNALRTGSEEGRSHWRQIDPQQRLDILQRLGAATLQEKGHQVVLPRLLAVLLAPQHRPPRVVFAQEVLLVGVDCAAATSGEDFREVSRKIRVPCTGTRP